MTDEKPCVGSTSLLLFLSPDTVLLGGNRVTGANYSLGGKKKFVLCIVIHNYRRNLCLEGQD